MAIRALRNALNSIVPNWLSNRPGLNTGFKFLYTMALMGDVLLEQGLEGLRAPWPGKGTPSALPLIGQSRGIIQGEGELEATYAARLINWLTTWENAASSETLAQQIQSYLGGSPTVRIVDRSDRWVIANPNGTTTFTAYPWNWDNSLGTDDQSPATVATWWSDIWIIVYPTPWAVQPILANSSTELTQTSGLGHQVTPDVVSAILSLVSTFKGAHTWVRAIIYTYSATSFLPGGSTMPDGTYGNWYKTTQSGVEMVGVQNRDTASRYWEPFQGG